MLILNDPSIGSFQTVRSGKTVQIQLEEQSDHCDQGSVKFLNFRFARKLCCNLPKIQEKESYWVSKIFNLLNSHFFSPFFFLLINSDFHNIMTFVGIIRQIWANSADPDNTVPSH